MPGTRVRIINLKKPSGVLYNGTDALVLGLHRVRIKTDTAGKEIRQEQYLVKSEVDGTEKIMKDRFITMEGIPQEYPYRDKTKIRVDLTELFERYFSPEDLRQLKTEQD